MLSLLTLILFTANAHAWDEWFSDPEYLKLRTEMIHFSSILNASEEWDFSSEHSQRCLDLASKGTERFPNDPFFLYKRIMYEVYVGSGTDVIHKYESELDVDRTNALRHWAVFMSKYINQEKIQRFSISHDQGEFCEAVKSDAMPDLNKSAVLDPNQYLYRIWQYQRVMPASYEKRVEDGMNLLDAIPNELPPTDDPVNCFPELWTVQYEIATYLLNLKQYQEASSLFEDLTVRFVPGNWDTSSHYHREFTRVFCNLGVCQDRRDLKDKAYESYKKALLIDPESIEALNNIAINCMSREKYQEGIDYFNRALRVAPDKTGIYQYMCAGYIQLKSRAKAQEALNKFKASHPDRTDVVVDLQKQIDQLPE